jgi:hypothetical protein
VLGNSQSDEHKFNMNFRKSTSCWPYRAKGLIHFWQIHNFCERLSHDWSFFYSICQQNMVYSAGENSELPLLQKIQTCAHFRRCQMSLPVRVQARHTLKIYETQRGIFHIMSPNNCGQSARADENVTDKDCRWTSHRRNTNMHRGFQASVFDTYRHITTFSVLTQRSTVGWHTCFMTTHHPHFLWDRIPSHGYCSHSSKTKAKSQVVRGYTTKTFRGSTATTALICNLSRKQR